MAAGITQPGAAGTTTFFEDDANADSNLDADNSTYSLADVVAKGLASADTTNLATFTPYFRSKCSLQNGDGTGTATTTFKAQGLACSFDTGKTYVVSTVGTANRWTKWGVKVVGAAGKPSGKNGVVMDFAASTIIRGNQLIYASKLKQWGSGLFQFLGGAGLSCEMVNTLLETVTAGLTVGNPTNPFQLISNVSITLGGTSVISNMVADLIEGVQVAVTGSNPHHFNSNSAFNARDVVLCGTPTLADLRLSSTVNFVNTIYSGNAPQYLNMGLFGDYFTYEPATQFYSTGVPVAGMGVRVLDINGAIIFDYISDALGGFQYNAGLWNENALSVRSVTAAVVTDTWPWTVRVNLDGAVNPTYAGYEYKYSPPYTNLPSTFGRQHQPMAPDILIYPAGFFDGGPPPSIPMEASGVQRIFAQVPEAA